MPRHSPGSGDDRHQVAARLIAHIDLDAIIANWTVLNRMSGCAGAVVKANGYGHGMIAVAKALAHAGCQQFFTASLDEAAELRAALPRHPIAYFDGLMADDIAVITALNLTPAINSPHQLSVLAKAAATRGAPLPAMLQLDTGMNRLGAAGGDAENMLNSPDLAAGAWTLVFSHLAAADEPDNPLNPAQKRRFDDLHPAAPKAPRSLAATGGIMLGADYHYDITRPGLGLYGLSPHAGYAASLTPALSLSAQVLQLRYAKKGETVGYGATHRLRRDSRLACIAGGYADGIDRRLSDRGEVIKDGRRAPMIGRVSMDVHVIDITDWPEHALTEGDRVMILNHDITAEDIAKKTATIPYQVLTTLGLRAKPQYAGTSMKQLDL
ncbi:MAG: alanine racemase [Alphaproteobacteria bacterium]|nr:alanine racemase [Alphaproteobacteria bacterium]